MLLSYFFLIDYLELKLYCHVHPQKPLRVTVIREGQKVQMSLTPQKWSGRGLLGWVQHTPSHSCVWFGRFSSSCQRAHMNKEFSDKYVCVLLVQVHKLAKTRFTFTWMSHYMNSKLMSIKWFTTACTCFLFQMQHCSNPSVISDLVKLVIAWWFQSKFVHTAEMCLFNFSTFQSELELFPLYSLQKY